MDIHRLKNFLLTVACCTFSVFHIYTSYFGVLSGLRQRIVHLAFTLVLTFWIFPFKSGKRSFPEKMFSVSMLILSAIACIHIFLLDPELPFREGDIYPIDVFFGLIAIFAVLEATRRVTGWQLPLISFLFMVYAYIGPYMPGIFGHRGFSISRIVYVVYLTSEGLLGMALYVSSSFIVLFIILAAFLKETGIGEFFIDIAFGAFGRVRGGPAKVAVVASSFFGTFSGSALANVTGTGTFTIPLMIRTGFSPQFAAAVEAVASTGGQFMPPIMASVAFVMAEILGISYIKVAIAAAIPAVLYYTGIFTQVDFRAAKTGLKGLPGTELPSVIKTLKRNGHLLLPLIVLLYVLGIKQLTPMRAAFWTIVCTAVVSMVRRGTRLTPSKTVAALKNGAVGTLSVATACANIGIIVGVLMLTGLGLKLSGMLIDIAQGSLFILLFLSMITSLIMGMGVPTLAAYLVLALVVAPALIQMGVKPMAAHLFMFYFGIISCITPPVALAAYTAAGISGSDPMKTGYQAVKLGITAFIVPFLFVYHPVLLMDGPVWSILQSSLTAFAGVVALASSLEGYFRGNLSIPLRIVMMVGSWTLIHPGGYSDLIGLGIIGSVAAFQHWEIKKSPATASAKTTSELSKV